MRYMKKTDKVNGINIDRAESEILKNLNADEICRLTDRLVVRGFVTCKALDLVIAQYTKEEG